MRLTLSAIILLAIGLSVVLCVAGSAPGRVESSFRVIVLPTDSAVNDMLAYPATVTRSVPTDQTSILAAYGVAERIFIAPRGWTGHGRIAIDAGAAATLHPRPGSPVPRGSIYYRLEYCARCALSAGAEYFESLRRHWDANAWGPMPPARPLVRKVSLSPRLIAYQASDTRDGLEVNGLVYSGLVGREVAAGYLFKILEVALPRSRHSLATTMLDMFGFPR